MNIPELLLKTEHRSWKMPTQPWKFYQEWNDAIFLHWAVDLKDLKKFVPHEVEIDLFEGKPWISLVAFSMEKVRPRNLPSFPAISDFDEINIRTYVKSNHKTGVYFLSMEAGKKLSCKLAQRISQLPYRFSKIERTPNRYKSFNPVFNDRLDIQFKIGEAVADKTPLEIWLTERYAIFQDTKTTLNEFEIHHIEWPLSKIELGNLEFNYPRFNHLINEEPHRMHYSKGVKVIAWGKLAKSRAEF